MKKELILTYRGLVLFPVSYSKTVEFHSAIEKADYIRKHYKKTYKFRPGCDFVDEYLYMVIDPEQDGLCLTPRHGITYIEALTLIDLYL